MPRRRFTPLPLAMYRELGRGAAYLNAYTYDGPMFHPNSPWNAPISASNQVDPNSATMMSTAIDGDGQGRTLGYWMTQHTNLSISATSGFSAPVWYGDPTISLKPVLSTSGYDGSTIGGTFPDGPNGVRIPAGAVPASGSDGHMVLWDIGLRIVYEFYRAIDNGDGTWNADHLKAFPDSGNGHAPLTPILESRAARGFGASLAAGQIRYWEIVRGEIKHPLTYTYTTTANHHWAQGIGVDGTHVNIGSSTDGDYDTGPLSVDDMTRQIPHGARIRLKASVDVRARAAGATHPSTARAIGYALQRYGAYQCDRGGNPSVYAEDLTGKGVSWTGILTQSDSTVFPPADFEVMSIPATLGFRA